MWSRLSFSGLLSECLLTPAHGHAPHHLAAWTSHASPEPESCLCGENDLLVSVSSRHTPNCALAA